MTAITVRLTDDQHERLKLLALTRRTSANQVLTGLLEAELARQLPGGTETVGDGIDRLRAQLGYPVITDAVRGETDRILAEGRAQAARIYGPRVTGEQAGSEAA